MNKLLLVAISLLLCMSAYGKEVSYLQDRNSMAYEVNQEKPYTRGAFRQNDPLFK